MLKYFIYCRKSTEEEERQILSIEAQLAELRDFAKQNNLFIVKEFTESKTAKEPGRPIFNEMLGEIEKGNASGILAWNPDRLARNSIDGGQIIYLVDTGKITSLKFPTFWFEPTPQGKFMLSVAFGQAKYYTDNLRENILRGIRQKIRRGELSAKAPLGYFNEPRLRTIEPDKKTFNKVKEILRAFATGDYTLSQIQDKMFSLGLVGKEGNPLHLSTIQGILKNPFYYGMFLYRGELHQGSHKPMISKKLFDKMQEALILNGKPRKKRGPKNFQFLNFAVCGECGYTITAERKIKKSGRKYHYYHCTFKSKTQKCSQRSFLREEAFAEQIKNTCQKVSLSNQDTEKVLAELEKDELKAKEETEIIVRNLKRELLEIEAKLEKLLDVYLNEVISTEEYTFRKQKILTRKLELQEKIRDFEEKGLSWLEPAREFVLKLNYAEKLRNSDNFSEMKTFLKNIGSNHILQNQKLIFSFKFPFNLAAEPRSGEAETLTYPKVWTQAESNCHLRNLPA